MITAYKAFYPGLKGMRNFQFAEGVTYTNADGARIGQTGFHAALDPVFCIDYISPERNGEYREVSIEGETDISGEYACPLACGYTVAVSTTRITIGRALTCDQMVRRAVDVRLSKALPRQIGSAFGDRSMATAHPLSGLAVASGTGCVAQASDDGSSARAAGERCLAIASGHGCSAHASGQYAVAYGTRPDSILSGGRGAWLLFTDTDGRTHARKAGTAGVRADTPYVWRNGRPAKPR